MADKVEKEYIQMSDIELNDGEFANIEAEEIKKDSEEEAQKEIEAREDVVDDINDAEAGKPELKTGDNKKFVIKGLKEGQMLTLEEPTDILNESTLAEDSDSFAGATDDDHVFSISVKVASMNEDDEATVAESIKELIEDYGEDYNIYLYQDPSAKLVEDLNEEVIDEVLPRELSKAYDNSRFKKNKGDFNRIDYQKANYKELTPEEAQAELKSGNFENLRLVLTDRNGRHRLVKVNDRGYGNSDYNLRITSVDDDKAYTKRSGQKVFDTNVMPSKHLFAIADKIYLTDENDDANKVDQNLLDTRKENPESPYYKGDDFEEIGGYPKDVISRLSNTLKKAIESGDEEHIKEYRARLADAKARLRYYNSEKFLTSPFKELKNLESEVTDYENYVNRKLKDLNTAKARGGYETRNNQERLERARREIDDLFSRLLGLEVALENSKEHDKESLVGLQKEYDDAVAKLADIKKQLADRKSGGIYKRP